MPRRLFYLVTVFLLLLGGAAFASSDTTVRADGRMTAREGDGSVVIDGKGFLVSPGARIESADGRSILLSALKLPAQVRFSYRYTPDGPVIVQIREGSVVPE